MGDETETWPLSSLCIIVIMRQNLSPTKLVPVTFLFALPKLMLFLVSVGEWAQPSPPVMPLSSPCTREACTHHLSLVTTEAFPAPILLLIEFGATPIPSRWMF